MSATIERGQIPFGERNLTHLEFWTLSIAGFASLFVLWSAVAMSGFVPTQFLPAPWTVAARFAELTRTPLDRKSTRLNSSHQ